jgi:hypothetical protein
MVLTYNDFKRKNLEIIFWEEKRSHPVEDATPPKEGNLENVGADLRVCP